MKFLKYLATTIGRILFSIIFIMAGIKKIFSWGSAKASIGTMLATWDAYNPTGFIGWMVNIIGNYVVFFIVLALALEIIGGLFILSGIKPRIGAFLLLVFMLPTTVFMHPFWLYAPNAGSMSEIQFVMFFKNLSIIGALFFIWAYDYGYRKTKKCCQNSLKDEPEEQSYHQDFSQEFREDDRYGDDK